MNKCAGLLVGIILLSSVGEAVADDLDAWDKSFKQGVQSLEAGDLQKAEKSFLEALIEARKKGEYSIELSSTYMNLGTIYGREGRHDFAERMFFNALAIDQRVLGQSHPDVAKSMINLAQAYALQQKYENAERLYMAALMILKENNMPAGPVAAAAFNNLSILYENQKKYDLAVASARNLLAVYKSSLGGDHPLVRETAERLEKLEKILKSS